MTWTTRDTEALSSVREVAGEPRTIEGIAVPYGVVSGDTEFGREAFYPGAFRASVEHWMGRSDGARMAYRPAHRQEPVGVVTSLRDTPDGVQFKAVIEESPDGDKYLRKVRQGLNGVSIEAGLSPSSKRNREGTVIHREARLFAIAGSISPAYDGARIALRDMEEPVDLETPAPTPEPEPTPTPDPAPEPGNRDRSSNVIELTPAVRSALERQGVEGYRSPGIVTRPELVYGPDRGSGAFIRDGWLAMTGDVEARERQARHKAHLTDISIQMERAGDLIQSEIPGALPTDFLPGLLTPRIMKGRVMGSFFDRFAISDTRPKTFAKVTTSGSVAVQSAEGAALTATDIATTAVTATPLMYGTYIDVSRQVLDSADPSATAMVLQDLIEGYAQASETVIKTAVEAGASASGTAITAATPFAGTLGNVIKYYTTRFKPAQAQFIPSALFAVLLAEADTTGRPKMPLLNPMNSDGTAAPGGVSGSVLGSTTYLSYASTTNVVVTARANDYVIYESSLASFSYDQVVGPQAVRIGIWAYLVVGTRLGALSVTAA